MGIEYKIDLQAGIIFLVGTGNIGAKEILAFFKKVISDPQFRPNLNTISDYRMAQIGFSGAESQDLANWTKKQKPAGKIALVMNPSGYGFARMYQSWVEDNAKVNIYKDMASAREWLGLPPEEE